MNRPPLIRCGWVAASLIFLTATLSAQVCPQPLPTNFEGLNGNGFPTPDNQAILNVFTNTDSTDPINFDNTAHAALGETISIQFDDARVSAGQPFTLMFSPGVTATGLNSPLLDGTIWMNPAAVFPLIDGLGLFGFVNPFGSTAGPNNIYQVFANTGLNPANIGLCITMQVAVFDPLSPAPYFLAISNPVALGFTPGITDLTPSVVAPGGTSTLSAPGRSNAGGDVITFPNGAAVVTGAGGVFSVPLSASSGQVTVDIAGITSTIVPDSITDYLLVRSPVVNTIVGALTMTPDPNLPFANSSRGTGFGNLAPNGIDVWTVSLQAGDVIEVEVFSTNSNWTKLNDGLGATINPFATIGFDPIVSIEQQTNGGDLLLFDGTFAPTGPYLLHFDDNDGPENNSFLSWQAKTTGIYNLVVGDANPNAYVTGNYVLNVRRVSGVFPCVTQFVSTSNARINIVPQGGSITMLGANLVPGQFYDVAFFPLAGDPFTGRLATGIQCAVAGRLTVPIPASQFGNLPMGLHQVQLTNATTGAIGAVWDNTRVVQPFGPLPDILCIRGVTRTTVTLNTLNVFGATPIAFLNSQSLLYGPFPTTAGSIAQGDGYFEFNAPANLTVVYVEALGVSDVNLERFDSHQGLTNFNGIYNPTLQLYRPPDLLSVGPYNDDDGQVPSLLFPFSMGIGNSAAVIDFDGPAFFPNGGLYQGLLQELVVIGQGASIPAIQGTHYCLVNVAVL